MSKITMRSSVGQWRAHFQHLVELLVVLDEQHAGAGIVDQIGNLLGRIGRIDAGAKRRRRRACPCRRSTIPARYWRGRKRRRRDGSRCRRERRRFPWLRFSHSFQLMVFQMPSTFSRKAGRSPRVSTASRKLFGKVSATVSTAGPSHAPFPLARAIAGVIRRRPCFSARSFPNASLHRQSLIATSSFASSGVRRARRSPWRRDRIPGCPGWRQAARRCRP